MSDGNARIFKSFADTIAGAAHTRADELGFDWGRELRFTVDFLLTGRCAVAALGAGELTGKAAEDTARFFDLEIKLTLANIQEAATLEDLADAVMRGSDGMHSFLLANELIERYLEWDDAASEWLDVLTYGYDDWRTERGLEAREARVRERAERRTRPSA